MENNALNHHGVKGQKWGIRRFQNKDGSLTAAGRKHRGIVQTIKDNNAKKKRQKQRAEALEKARAARQAKADEAAEKKRVLESGTAEEVMKYKGKLTNKELGDAYQRLNYEQLISGISAKEAQANHDRTSDLLSRTELTVNKIQRGVDTAQKGLDSYNKAAKIVNAMTEADLPTFEGNKKTKAAEDAMNKLIKSGTAEQITKQFGKLSVQQLQDANKRFVAEDQIKKRAAQDKADREASKTTSDNDTKSNNESSTSKKTSDTKTKTERVDAEVVGDSTSRSNIKNDTGYSKKDKPADYYDPIDTSFVNESTMSEVRNSQVAQIGSTTIAGLLEDKSR